MPEPPRPPSLTILTSSDELGKPTGFMTKRVTASGIKGHGFPPTYVSKAPEVGSIFDLAAQLDSLATQPHSCVIRGRKLDTAPTVHRRIAAEGDKDRAYEKQGCQWLCLDMDKQPLQLLGCEPGTFPQVLARKVAERFLPSAFHLVTNYYQASSSHGYKTKKEDTERLSMHLWFWLDRPITDEEAKQYIQQLNRAARVEYCIEGKVFDDALYNPVQPHFTADPVLDPGIEPLPYPRRGLDRFDRHVVPISTELDLIEGNWLRHLGRFGDDKEGFWSPILGATGCYVHEHGKAGLLPAPREAVKEKIRQAIDLADQSRHSIDQITRYKSDAYLDNALESAEGKGWGQAGIDEAVDAASQEFIYCRYTDDYFHKARRFPTSAKGVKNNLRLTKDVTRDKAFQRNIQHADMARSIPGQKDCRFNDEGIEVWSSWPGRKLEPTYGDASVFTDHVAKLAGHHPLITRSALDWFAHLLAKPGERIMWALVIGSIHEGVGKSLLGQLMGRLITGTKFLTDNDITEKFKDFLIDNELAVCEEIRIDAKLNAADAMKVFITEPRVNVRRFGRPHETIRNYCHFLMFTNHRDALPLHQEGDRRYLVIMHEDEPEPDEYYQKLANFIKYNASDVLGWALNRDLRHFSPFAPPPQTEAAKRMAELSQPERLQTIAEMIRERQPPFDFRVAVTTEVRNWLRIQCSSQQLRDLIGHNGGLYRPIKWEEADGRGTTKAVFVFDDMHEGWGARPAKELQEQAMEESRRRSKRTLDRKIEEEVAIDLAKEEAREMRLRLVGQD